MATKITFMTNQQAHHLEVAKQLTGSDGFMSDARAIAAYLPGDTGMDLLAVAVFECFRGGRAELHLGCAPGKRLTPEIITTVSTLAFHPKFFGVDTLVCRVPTQNVNAICTLLKIGFEVEYRDRSSVVGGGDGIVLSLSKETVLASAGPVDEDYRAQMAPVEQE
ncbi:hypothetical protein [Paracoccus hibiscisoli]|uniref:GNAT family N-acetyltransferase n=1 Tax=Paracoccus hibiscisoli TaxID=2023261 RepID=A0A4U0QV00_9RHOB|nr:hypothetical protein [Paracoccus hibiscisoli]TJZ85836.1 hypothetical protein FA740_05395 [Paracoccus hibiscisoli]